MKIFVSRDDGRGDNSECLVVVGSVPKIGRSTKIFTFWSCPSTMWIGICLRFSSVTHR